ncbi:MAG: tRNA dihydrouridine synthase DusB [Phycisphaerales bacterium JB038]
MLQIGDLQLATPLLLAPIAGHCDLPFRLVCRRLGGVGLACTDLLSPAGLVRSGERPYDLARTTEEDQPLSMQLYGSDSALMAEGARWVADHGARLVDINMGCPVDKVTKKDGGAKLLCKTDKAKRIVEAVLAAVDLPVTVKVRLGWDAEHQNAPELARTFEQLGAAAITVHGRTARQRFKGVVDLDGIREVVQAVGRIPVIGNGDVKCGDDARQMLSRTGCAGVMIGRAALSKPWIFREVDAALRGETVAEFTVRRKLEIIREHVEEMRRYRGDRRTLPMIRQRIAGYGTSLGHVKPLKETLRLARDFEVVFEALGAYIDDPRNTERTFIERSEDPPPGWPFPRQAG